LCAAKNKKAKKAAQVKAPGSEAAIPAPNTKDFSDIQPPAGETSAENSNKLSVGGNGSNSSREEGSSSYPNDTRSVPAAGASAADSVTAVAEEEEMMRMMSMLRGKSAKKSPGMEIPLSGMSPVPVPGLSSLPLGGVRVNDITSTGAKGSSGGSGWDFVSDVNHTAIPPPPIPGGQSQTENTSGLRKESAVREKGKPAAAVGLKVGDRVCLTSK